jgi:hypothetical protein
MWHINLLLDINTLSNSHATVENLLEAVFSVRLVPSLYEKGLLPLEGSTIALRVVRGDAKGTQSPGI